MVGPRWKKVGSFSFLEVTTPSDNSAPSLLFGYILKNLSFPVKGLPPPLFSQRHILPLLKGKKFPLCLEDSFQKNSSLKEMLKCRPITSAG